MKTRRADPKEAEMAEVISVGKEKVMAVVTEALEVMNVAATTATQAQAPAVAMPVAVATAQ